ncbi:MAG: hypothetical protein JST40_01550 [Armatimonadetes bacterium]|nr:hypothetical protein [Armatimonadota bacterium]
MSQQFQPGEVEEILRRAVQSTAPSDSMTRDQLVATARELGMDEVAIDQAIASYREDLQRTQTAEEEKDLRRQFAQERRARMWTDFGSTFSVAVMLVGINFVTSGMSILGMFGWSKWPAGIMTVIAVAGLVEKMFAVPTETKFQEWKLRRQKRLNKATLGG